MTATTDRIDVKNLSTAATRALADAEPGLTEAIARKEQSIRSVAEKMTITDLKEVTEVGHGTKPAAKADWVELYVKQQLAQSPCSKELDRLRMEAVHDKMLAGIVNSLMNEADEADTLLRNIVNSRDGQKMFYELTWKIDGAFTAQVAGFYATQVAQAVNDGYELRDVCVQYLRDAVRKILRFPSLVGSNGLSGGLRMEGLIEAQAAERFRERITRHLRVEMVDAAFVTGV